MSQHANILLPPAVALSFALRYLHAVEECAASQDEEMSMRISVCQLCNQETQWSKDGIVEHVREHVKMLRYFSLHVHSHAQTGIQYTVREIHGRLLCEVPIKPGTADSRTWFCAASFADHADLLHHWDHHLKVFELDQLPHSRPWMMPRDAYDMVPFDHATKSWVLPTEGGRRYRPVNRVFGAPSPLQHPLADPPPPAPVFTVWREVRVPTESHYGTSAKAQIKRFMSESSQQPNSALSRRPRPRTRKLGVRNVIGTSKAKHFKLQGLKLPDPAKILARGASLGET